MSAFLSVPGDARSRAMGGVSVAIQGESFVYGNPARLVNFTRAGLSGAVGQDYRSLKYEGQSQNLRSTEFFSFRGVFPSYKKFVVSARFLSGSRHGLGKHGEGPLRR